MCERKIVKTDDAYVLFDQDDRRLSAYAVEGEAIEAAEDAIEALGGGTLRLASGEERIIPAPALV